MDVIMPQLGETVLEGTIAAWYKKAGDTVKADESLFDLETEKVTTEIPAPVSGVLTEILVEAGATVKVGARLAVIDSGEAAAPKPSLPAAATPAIPAASPAGVTGAPLPRPAPGGPKLSPVVRRLLGEHGIAPEHIAGSGAAGRIIREDVLAYLERPRADPAIAESAPRLASAPLAQAAAEPRAAVAMGPDDYAVPLNKVRRLTAAHMLRSKATSPHAFQAVEVDFHAVDKVRRAIGADWKAREGHSLTYLPFIARAVCEAIAEFPRINSSFGVDEIIVHRRVHLGIAVDLNFDGLMVPVIRDAHHKNLRGMACELNRLSRAAREGNLKSDELGGGTYTISNSGSFGTLISASIINQPQAAILSSDGVHKKPAVVATADGDMIAIRPIGILAQSFDHRAFDGAYSAAFLKRLREILETRDWLAEVQ